MNRCCFQHSRYTTWPSGCQAPQTQTNKKWHFAVTCVSEPTLTLVVFSSFTMVHSSPSRLWPTLNFFMKTFLSRCFPPWITTPVTVLSWPRSTCEGAKYCLHLWSVIDYKNDKDKLWFHLKRTGLDWCGRVVSTLGTGVPAGGNQDNWRNLKTI